MTKAQVYVDGSVYSPADPYATAMVVQDDKVVWVGSDAGAESIFDDSMTKVELNGNLLTPSFIHSYQAVSTEKELKSVIETLLVKGYSTAILSTANPDLAQSSTQYLELNWLFEIEKCEELPNNFDGFDWKSDELTAQDFDLLVKSGAKVLSFNSSVAPQIIDFCQNYGRKELPILRVENFQNWDEQQLLLTFAKLQINVGINIDSILKGFNVHELSNSAVPYYLVSDALNKPEKLGWESVRIGIEKVGLSARAAFNSLTKGAARSYNAPLFQGQLVPEAPAFFSQWQVNELMVQTADSRVANWSTDPRARIPLLPVLEQGSEPLLIRNYPVR